ncbi:hypothetical protein Tco_1556924 [Tanacetum coccineum]
MSPCHDRYASTSLQIDVVVISIYHVSRGNGQVGKCQSCIGGDYDRESDRYEQQLLFYESLFVHFISSLRCIQTPSDFAVARATQRRNTRKIECIVSNESPPVSRPRPGKKSLDDSVDTLKACCGKVKPPFCPSCTEMHGNSAGTWRTSARMQYDENDPQQRGI